MITQVDHVIINCPDLGAMATIYGECLGFAVTDGGRHKGLGTRNLMVEFPLTFLELLGEDEEAPSPHERFASDPGPQSFLLRTNSLAEDLDHLQDAGFEVAGPIRYQRQGEDGEPRILHVGRVVGLEEGLGITLVEPEGQAGLRRSVVHPNSAYDLGRLAASSVDPSAVAAAYRAMGIPVDVGHGGSFVAVVGETAISVGPAAPETGCRTGVTEIALRARSLSSVERYLSEHHVSFTIGRPADRRDEVLQVQECNGSDVSYLSFFVS